MKNVKPIISQRNVFYGSYWKQGKGSLCKKHLYKGFSKNSCQVDLIDIKNTLPKHQQICSKIQKQTSRVHHRIHYKTCPSHNRTSLIILSDYKRSFCHFRQDLLVCQEPQFYLFLIPCCPLSFKTERTIFLIFALAVVTHFADQINFLFGKFY